MKRLTQSLNGYWDYSINGVAQNPVKVPGSQMLVGQSRYEKEFIREDIPEGQSVHAELLFEGITYQAEVTLNGQKVGQMGPYSRYSFDVTNLLEKHNHLVVDIQDMHMAFGPSEGWENYGGIIRDVAMVYMDEAHITDIIWRTRTEYPYQEAICSVAAVTEGAAESLIEAQLYNREGNLVADTTGSSPLELIVKNPRLWSPDEPYLYTLQVIYGEDAVSQQVGIKDFHIEGQRFILNGRPLFLKGINRHDMWGDQGYTLTREQMETDMRMIKSTGCNYVRLVHYPHHPYILELADRLGLLVSEEPGLWWSDMKNQEVTDGALEVMERVVKRDRNHISVAFWLAFNECVFTPEFLEASSGLCRKLDPDRPVSGANAMNKEMTKELFTKHGFDFYTRHPYTYHIEEFEQEEAYLNDRPLVFTEWGGLYVFENGALFEDSLRNMIEAWRRPDGQAVLAGCAYWCWADMYEFGRGRIACSEGILNEGLVDIYRHPRSNLDRFAAMWRQFDLPVMPEKKMEVILAPEAKPFTNQIPVSLAAVRDTDQQEQLFKDLLAEATPQEGYVHKTKRRLENGPVFPESVTGIGGIDFAQDTKKPLVIPPGKMYEIPLDPADRANALYILGNSCLPWGYPLYGEKGEVGAEYVIGYANGTTTTIPLRNGIELTTCLGQQGPSRVNPVAPGVKQAIRWSYDTNWEHYIANLYRIDLDMQKKAVSLQVRSMHEKCSLLLYGLTLAAADTSRGLKGE